LKNLIKELKPDVLTKGSDYKKEEVVGQDIVKQYGGKIVLIPIFSDISSSGIIRKVINNSFENLGFVSKPSEL